MEDNMVISGYSLRGILRIVALLRVLQANKNFFIQEERGNRCRLSSPAVILLNDVHAFVFAKKKYADNDMHAMSDWAGLLNPVFELLESKCSFCFTHTIEDLKF